MFDNLTVDDDVLDANLCSYQGVFTDDQGVFAMDLTNEAPVNSNRSLEGQFPFELASFPNSAFTSFIPAIANLPLLS